MKHLVSLADWTKDEILNVIEKAINIKKKPEDYYNALPNKTLLMIFEKPSLRTHLSFEIAMTQLGGHGIYYNTSHSPLGKGKETIEDTIKVISRYADIIMARLYSHQTMVEMARYSNVPVINGLTNFSHPCQILGDLLTIKEKKGKLENLKLVYYGDARNNVTHSLLYGCSKVGISITIACPSDDKYCPEFGVLSHAIDIGKQTGAKVELLHDPKKAAENADIIYTDSWMSYHIPPEEEKKRINELTPFRVTEDILKLAKDDVIFMHCLPAMRGYEQTAEVIDGKASVVFDEAENRLHIQKAIILTLLGK